LGATCGTTSSNGNEPVALAVGGGSITVSQSAGNPRPGHNYDYCMDFAVLPPSFSTGVSWSQSNRFRGSTFRRSRRRHAHRELLRLAVVPHELRVATPVHEGVEHIRGLVAP